MFDRGIPASKGAVPTGSGYGKLQPSNTILGMAASRSIMLRLGQVPPEVISRTSMPMSPVHGFASQVCKPCWASVVYVAKTCMSVKTLEGVSLCGN